MSHVFRHALFVPGISLSLISAIFFLLSSFPFLYGSLGFCASNKHPIVGGWEGVDCGGIGFKQSTSKLPGAILENGRLPRTSIK